ncbi:MAG: right-handed parallel beta-helix repeat-containing protein [Acidobacteriaceae bacterium]|nr:right-handed parallel beta-helix repeat-containing protein [Acidobacteriaceae bacterium]
MVQRSFWVLVAALFAVSVGAHAQQVVHISAQQVAGGDVGAWITRADYQLGAQAGVIEVDAPGSIAGPVTLSPGHSLTITAPLLVQAPITLSANQSVSCKGAQSAIEARLAQGAALFQAEAASDLKITGCQVTTNAGYILAVHKSGSRIQMSGNRALHSGIFLQSGPGSDLTFTNNYAKDAPFGIYLCAPGIHNAVATGNVFEGGGNGIEVFAHLAGEIKSMDDLLAKGSGDMIFTGNRCTAVAACIWTSAAYRVTIASNVAKGCGDTCFDAEGSGYVTFSHNVASGGVNFEYSEFFAGYNNVFDSNTGIGGTVFRLKNDWGIGATGRVVGTVLRNNHFDCGAKLCPAIVLEANSQTVIENNILRNGYVIPVGASDQLTLRGNQMSFTVADKNSGLSVPPPFNGHTTLVESNVIHTTVAQQGDCISSSNFDFNNVNTLLLRKNVCQGNWAGNVRFEDTAHHLPQKLMLEENSFEQQAAPVLSGQAELVPAH